MGITRDGLFKRRATGAKRVSMRKKKKYQLGRPPAMTKIGPVRVHPVRVRGGNIKRRAIRLEHGSFSWPSEACAKQARVIEVVYNASNNELVRTNTLVKGAIVHIDGTPFSDWYRGYYGVSLAKIRHEKKDDKKEGDKKEGDKKDAKDAKPKKVVERKTRAQHPPKQPEVTDADRQRRAKDQIIDPAVAEQLKTGRVLARISSRPGQVGCVDGYILEGAELAFYQKKIQRRR